MFQETSALARNVPEETAMVIAHTSGKIKESLKVELTIGPKTNRKYMARVALCVEALSPRWSL